MGSVADADCILAGTVQRIGPDKDHPATKGCWAFNEEGCLQRFESAWEEWTLQEARRFTCIYLFLALFNST